MLGCISSRVFGLANSILIDGMFPDASRVALLNGGSEDIMRLSVVGSILVLGAVASETMAAPPDPGPVPVTVVNPLPVPVTGTVNVTGNVSVAAQEPFQMGTVSTGFVGSSGTTPLIVVPAGKRLVIEGVSANVNATASGGLASVNINTGAFDRVNELVCVPVGATPSDLNHWFQCSSQVKLHAGPGTTVSFAVSTAGSLGGYFRVFVSGYYVPVP